MIVSKPAIIFHSSQAFLSFLAMCCFASVASFQAKHGVGPCACFLFAELIFLTNFGSPSAGLSGFAIFISIVGIILPLFMLLVPVFDVKYGRLTHLSRALSEVRVGFILTSTGTSLTLLIAYAFPLQLALFCHLIRVSVSSLLSLLGRSLAAKTLITTRTPILAIVSKTGLAAGAQRRKPVQYSFGCLLVCCIK